MASARTLFALAGIGVAALGVAVAGLVDHYIGMGLLVVGGFLLILPFTTSRPDD